MADDAGREGFWGDICRGSRSFWSMALRPLQAGAVAGVVLLTGCGDFFNPSTTGTTTTTTTNSGDYLYVANANTLLNSIAAIQINSGVFTFPSTSPYVLADAGSPTALAVSPNNAFLYVASGVLNTGIYEYAINSDGSLTAQNSGAPQAVATDLIPSSLVVDPTGQWLIAFQSAGLTGGTTNANVFAIDSSTGALSNPTAGAEQVTIDTGSVGQVVFNPASSLNAAGTSLYVTLGASGGVANTGGVDILGFDPATGALQLNGNLPPVDSAGAAEGVAINPAGTYLFVTETGNITGTTAGGNGVRSLAIVSVGELSLSSNQAYQTGGGAGAVLVDATGAYLYVANRADGTISPFSISSTTGSLTAIGSAAISSGGSIPAGIVEDNSKTYIGVVCEGGSPDLQLFTFDATTPGQLDPASSGALTTGSASPAEAIAIAATH